jgi:hypothetical protein
VTGLRRHLERAFAEFRHRAPLLAAQRRGQIGRGDAFDAAECPMTPATAQRGMSLSFGMPMAAVADAHQDLHLAMPGIWSA